jgi:AcrR family transcriptional regulator
VTEDLLTHGRTRQKLRTRTALVTAAQRLIAEGKSPTVEDAAESAGISRTTAYRYFKNQSDLLAQVHPEIQRSSLLPDRAPTDVFERLEIVVKQITRVVSEGEAHYRTMLRLSLDESVAKDRLVLRQGRAIAWIEDALAPLKSRFSRAQIRRLAVSIRSAIGIEALVWLVDVAGQSRDEAVKTMRWSARAMLRGALAGEL